MKHNLLKTPLYAQHVALGARMVPFAGFEMPVQYFGVLEEVKTCRAHGGIFDVSHMGQITLKGKNVLESFQRLVTNDLKRLSPHQVQYNLLCNEAGGVVDDILVYFRGADELFLCVNASNRNTVLQWLQERLPQEISVQDESDKLALIAVQGPKAESLLRKISPKTPLEKLYYYWSMPAVIGDIPVLLSRTGYTGEDGFELYVDSMKASQLWEILLSTGKSDGIIPCGLGARDTLRLEMGYPLHGHEISPTITPLQAGLQWAVKMASVLDFCGKQSLQGQSIEGVTPLLKAFIVNDKRIARQGYEIASMNKLPIGTISSGSFSPHLGQPIALGFVKKEVAQEKEFWVKIRNDWVPMSATSLPFVPSRVRKAPK